MRRLHHFILVAVVAGLALPAAASACSPAMLNPPPTPAQQVHDADVAFTGTVESTAPGDFGATRWTVAVDRVLKGTVPARVELVAGISSCGMVGFTVGGRVGLTLYPSTPMPWDVDVFDDLGPAAMDPLPRDGAYRPTRVTGVAARRAGVALQLHFRARTCASVLGTIKQAARSITASLTTADGPKCTSGARVDRCVVIKANRALGTRAVRPASARRVAAVPAKRCLALAS